MEKYLKTELAKKLTAAELGVEMDALCLPEQDLHCTSQPLKFYSCAVLLTPGKAAGSVPGDASPAQEEFSPTSLLASRGFLDSLCGTRWEIREPPEHHTVCVGEHPEPL